MRKNYLIYLDVCCLNRPFDAGRFQSRGTIRFS
jgi:hypothetical protein